MSTLDQVYQTTINATAEQVWDAITNPEFTRQYWFGNANVSNWEKGANWQHVGIDGGHVHHEGIVEECNKPHKLVLSWHNPGEAKDVSRVTFTIEAHQDGVQLTVLHGDFIDGSAMATRVAGGWPKVVANLKEFVESGSASFKSGCAA